MSLSFTLSSLIFSIATQAVASSYGVVYELQSVPQLLAPDYCPSDTFVLADTFIIDFDLTINVHPTQYLHVFDILSGTTAILFVRYNGYDDKLFLRYLRKDGAYTISYADRIFTAADDGVAVHHKIIKDGANIRWEMDDIIVLNAQDPSLYDASDSVTVCFPDKSNAASAWSANKGFFSHFRVFANISTMEPTTRAPTTRQPTAAPTSFCVGQGYRQEIEDGCRCIDNCANRFCHNGASYGIEGGDACPGSLVCCCGGGCNEEAVLFPNPQDDYVSPLEFEEPPYYNGYEADMKAMHYLYYVIPALTSLAVSICVGCVFYVWVVCKRKVTFDDAVHKYKVVNHDEKSDFIA